MAEKIVASISIIVGGFATILSLLVAFGVNITPDQHTAIVAVAGIVMMIVGVWLHPNVPVGVVEPTKDAPPELGTQP